MGRQTRAVAAVVLVLAALVGATVWLVFAPTGGGDATTTAAPPTSDTAPADDAAPRAGAARRGAATAKVTGEVRRSSDRAPVAGQRVMLDGTRPKSVEVETDERGAFAFEGLP